MGEPCRLSYLVQRRQGSLSSNKDTLKELISENQNLMQRLTIVYLCRVNIICYLISIEIQSKALYALQCIPIYKLFAIKQFYTLQSGQ